MRDWVRADRRRWVLVAGIMALAVLGSGCSSAGSGGRPNPGTTVAQEHRGGPVPVSWAQALALAHLMLSRLALPPGARPVPDSTLPVSQRWQPAPPAMAAVLQAYQLPQPARQAFQDVLSRPPAGTLPGAVSSAEPVTDHAVTYLLRTEPPGVFVAQLEVIVAPRQGGGSWLTTEAHVAVLYSSTLHSCFKDTVVYRLDFAASANSPPAATVEGDSCAGIENVTVQGIPVIRGHLGRAHEVRMLMPSPRSLRPRTRNRTAITAALCCAAQSRQLPSISFALGPMIR